MKIPRRKSQSHSVLNNAEARVTRFWSMPHRYPSNTCQGDVLRASSFPSTASLTLDVDPQFLLRLIAAASLLPPHSRFRWHSSPLAFQSVGIPVRWHSSPPAANRSRFLVSIRIPTRFLLSPRSCYHPVPVIAPFIYLPLLSHPAFSYLISIVSRCNFLWLLSKSHS